MSCVDAAIIKALVEHIGMDPEDVPVGGGSSHTSLETYVDGCNIKIFDGYGADQISTQIFTPLDKPLRIGDVIRIKDNGVLYSYYLAWTTVDENGKSQFRGYDFNSGNTCLISQLSPVDSQQKYNGTFTHDFSTVDQTISKENGTGVFRGHDTIAHVLTALIHWITFYCQSKTT